MSHFAVVVIVPDKKAEITDIQELEEKVAKMLAPYQENNMDDCPEQYLKFYDVEEEHREKWNNDTIPRLRLADGTLDDPYGSKYETGTLLERKYTYPDGSEKVEVPIKGAFSTFDEYITDYCGYKKDEKTGKYGYWENPSAKWNWYEIGGRWTGFFYAKSDITCSGFNGTPGLMTPPNTDPFTKDAIRAGQLDWEKINDAAIKAAEKFWSNWIYFRDNKREPDKTKFYGVRYEVIRLGFINPKFRKELTEEDKSKKVVHVRDYADSNGKENDIYDVYGETPACFEELIQNYLDFFSPISAYALLDSDGWHAPGKMGWWGCSSDTAGDRKKFKNEFIERLLKADKNDWLVAVDCHI
jgi:hypothetical protein